VIDEGDRIVENSKDREIHPYELVHAAAPSNSHTANYDSYTAFMKHTKWSSYVGFRLVFPILNEEE